VLSSFKAFGASPSSGVFGAPVLGSSSSAGELRGNSNGRAADDSDDDDGPSPSEGQRIGFEEGAISMDQVRFVSFVPPIFKTLLQELINHPSRPVVLPSELPGGRGVEEACRGGGRRRSIRVFDSSLIYASMASVLLGSLSIRSV
jgi:hypothetical protein